MRTGFQQKAAIPCRLKLGLPDVRYLTGQSGVLALCPV